MRRFLTGLLLLIVTRSIGGQTVAGRVLEGATATPIGGATVTVVDGQMVVLAGRTNDSGSFELRLPKAGSFTLRVARLGFEGLSTQVKVESGGRSTNVYRLSPMVTSMDTVRRTSKSDSGPVTTGRELFRQHALTNRGQMVSGLEIRKSKLSVSEYLGTLPGLHLAPTVVAPTPEQAETVSPPTIPGMHGYLIPAHDERCLYGRIDHWSIIGLLDHTRADNIDELLSVDDVMAVEVYNNFQEIPKEWRSSAIVQELIWHRGAGGRSYLIGDTGVPAYPRYTIRANPRDPIVNGIDPFRIQSLRAPGVSAAEPVHAALAGYETRVGAVDGAIRVYNDTTAPYYRIGTPIDTILPPSFALPSMQVPQCGFVQIWTRKSW